MPRLRVFLSVIASVSFLFSSLPAVEGAPPTDEQLTQWKQTADVAAAERDQQATEVKQAQEQLLALQRALAEHKSALAKAEEMVKKEAELFKPLQEAVVKADGEKKPADEALAAAQKEVEAAKGTDQEKAKTDVAATADAAAKAKAKALEDAQAALKKTEDEIAAAKGAVAAKPAEIQQAEAQIPPAQEKLNAVQAKQAELAERAVVTLREYQHGLIAADKLVSFAEKVAPIFSQRCLACHNARTAKGRYNMENFAAIIKGGESGVAVEAGNGGLSTLYIMIEDGSMPKDADPLTAEELALVKKWIDTGAVLDAGMAPSAELITIMPKLAQPAPPEKYRVAVPVTALSFSPDGTKLASAGYHEVLVWNPENGALLQRITNLAERIYDVEFSQDGQRLAVAAGTPAQLGEVKLFNAADGTLQADLIRTGDSVFAVAFSPDGTKLACACADRSIRVYDIATQKQVLLIEDHADWVIDIAWAPDGSKLASASRDKTSKVFDMKTGDSLVTFNTHNNTVSGVAFTADGTQVVTSGADKQLRVWTVADAKQVRNIGGFGDEIFRVIVSPEGEVFSVSADKNSRRHNVGNGQALKTYTGHQDWVYSLARHAGSKRIATGSYDGEIKIWNEDEAKVILGWTAAPGFETQQAAK